MLKDGNNNNFFWWKEKDKEVHKSIFQYISFLDKHQAYHRSGNVKHMRLYGSSDYMRSHPWYSHITNTQLLDRQGGFNIKHRVTLNVIQSMIDTVTSKITKNKPRASFLTDGGDWSLQQKAKKLTKFVDGQFHNVNYHAESARAFQDSCIFGTGAVKIFRKGNKIKAERVLIDELIVDDAESIYGQPRQMHQVKFYNREVLKEMFPKYAGAIDAAEGSEPFNMPGVRQQNMIVVIESWHLPSGPDAKDGKRAITIENQTLLVEEYNKQYFPFVVQRWGVRPIGFFGQGLAEQLSGIQLEINKILRTIQISMHLVSVPKLLVEASSKIVKAHLDNKIGGIITYAGTPPTFGPLGKVPPDLFSHLDRLYQRAFEVAGVSQLSAQSAKPSGLDSGKALREFTDIESERFMDVATRYEQTYLEAAKIMIDLTRDIAKDTDDFKVRVKGGKFLQTINWKEIDMEDDKYLMQVFPTSSLSQHPAGRLQDVQELMQAGLIGREQGMKLLDFPDLEAFYNFNNAGIEDIERVIDEIIEKGNYQTPEPFQNLEFGIMKMQQAYLHFRAQKAPEERLDLLRRWIDDANALMQRAQQEAQAQQADAMAQQQMEAQGAIPPVSVAPPPADPTGQAAEAPISDLLPTEG
jgi:hypothetical protein